MCEAKASEDVITIEEGEDLKGGFPLEALAAVTVDMGTQKAAVVLGKAIKGRTLGQDGTDEFVGAFNGGFLIGVQRIAVEDAGPPL